MPIYEYRCQQCGKEFEMLQGITVEPLKKCIYCSGAVQKLISAPSFKFKGNGWYSTDYKKSAHDVGNKASDKSKAETQPATDNKKMDNAHVK
jgi:putative FmdB family regulatory protein